MVKATTLLKYQLRNYSYFEDRVKVKPMKVGLCLPLVASLVIATAPVSRMLRNVPPLDGNYELWLCAQLKQKTNNRLGRLKSLKGATHSDSNSPVEH